MSKKMYRKEIFQYEFFLSALIRSNLNCLKRYKFDGISVSKYYSDYS